MLPGKRYFWPDEEPEPDFPRISHESYEGTCKFCGHEGHNHRRCPNKPKIKSDTD